MTPDELAEAMQQVLLGEWTAGPANTDDCTPEIVWGEWITDDPEQAWPVFLKLLERDWEFEALETIAGPLDWLLQNHWEGFEWRVRELAARYDGARRLLLEYALRECYYEGHAFTRSELVETFLTYDAAFGQYHKVDELAGEEPEAALPVIVELINRLPAAGLNYDHVQGPLRLLLSKHGPAVVDRIELAAASSSGLRRVLWRVCKSAEFWAKPYPIGPAILDRLTQAVGATTVYSTEPPPPESQRLTAEQESLILGWISCERSFWASAHVDRLLRDKPNEAWEVLLDLIAKAPTDEELDFLGVHLIEDLMRDYAGAYIEKIEQQALADPRFRTALQNVWRVGMSDDIWVRLLRAAGRDLETSKV